jgi:polyferredoxin
MANTTGTDRASRPEQMVLRLPMWLCELIGSGVLLWAFWVYLAQARALKAPLNPADMGAGGFPILLGTIGFSALVLLIVLLVIRRTRSPRSHELTIPRPLFVLATMALMAGQAVLFDLVGALVSVFVFSVATIWLCGERRPLHVLGVPVLLAAFIYVVFVLALGVSLPAGGWNA